MSDRLIAAAARQYDPARPGESAVPQVALVREAVTTLGWGTMTYACEACGFEWAVWLALGVEGPQALRDAGLFVPAPFTLSSCPAWPVRPDATADERATFRHLGRCDGAMQHVRWGDDEAFEPRLMPDDAPRFVLDQWYDAARIVIPEPALVLARRFHNERGVDG